MVLRDISPSCWRLVETEIEAYDSEENLRFIDNILIVIIDGREVSLGAIEITPDGFIRHLVNQKEIYIKAFLEDEGDKLVLIPQIHGLRSAYARIKCSQIQTSKE